MTLEKRGHTIREERARESREKGGEMKRGFGFDVRLTIDVGGGDEARALSALVGSRQYDHVAGDVLVLVDLEDVPDLGSEEKEENQHARRPIPFRSNRSVQCSTESRVLNSSHDRSSAVSTQECRDGLLRLQ